MIKWDQPFYQDAIGQYDAVALGNETKEIMVEAQTINTESPIQEYVFSKLATNTMLQYHLKIGFSLWSLKKSLSPQSLTFLLVSQFLFSLEVFKIRILPQKCYQGIGGSPECQTLTQFSVCVSQGFGESTMRSSIYSGTSSNSGHPNILYMCRKA